MLSKNKRYNLCHIVTTYDLQIMHIITQYTNHTYICYYIVQHNPFVTNIFNETSTYKTGLHKNDCTCSCYKYNVHQMAALAR